MGLEWAKERSMIDKEKCNDPSSLDAGERVPRGRTRVQRAWFAFLHRWKRPASVRKEQMQARWAQR